MNKQSGFTLFELMITLAAIAILSSLAGPNLMAWLANTRLNSSANDVCSVFERAKMAAINEHCDVVVKFQTGTGESGSYRVFVDDDNGGTLGAFDPGEREIVSRSSMEKGVELQSADFKGGWNVSTRFNSMGMPAGFNGDVVLKNDDVAVPFRRIVVGFAGVVKLEKSADGTTWSG